MNTKKQGINKKQARIREQKQEAIAKIIGFILLLYILACHSNVVDCIGTSAGNHKELAKWNYYNLFSENGK